MPIKRDKYDAIISDAVRLRDGWKCQRCSRVFPEGSRQGLQCSHYFGRAAKSTRYELDNCIALCHGCHGIWGSKDREDYRQHMIDWLGEDRFYEITRQSKAPRNWKVWEKDELLEHYRAEIDSVNSARARGDYKRRIRRYEG